MSQPLPNERLLWAGDYPDPSICFHDGWFYATHSSFNYAPGLQIWRSRDALSWEAVGNALPRHDGDVWAPEIVVHDGRFFVYYKSSFGVRVVWANAAEGAWSEPVSLELSGIDPGHITDREGNRFLHLSEGRAVRLAPDGLRKAGEVQKVYDGWPIPEAWRIESFSLEGPKLFWRGDWCYLVSAQGGTAGPATSHMAVVARARHPLGPWGNSPHGPLIRTQSRAEQWHSRGHTTLFEAAPGRWRAMYHAYERGFTTLGRQTLCCDIEWSADDWPMLAQSEAELPHPRPFYDGQWRFWDESPPVSMENEANFTLPCRGDSPLEGHIAAQICGAHVYEFSVEVELLGEAARGGLALFYSGNCWRTFGISAQGIEVLGRTWPELRKWPTGRENTRRLSLKIVNDAHETEFWTREQADEPWKRFNTGMEASGWHHNTFGGFLSLRPALWCCGEGAVRFSDFKLQILD